MDSVQIVSIFYGMVLGAAIGSFLGCVVYRLPRRESLLGRSHCPLCGEQIPAERNIPVISWIRLRGRSECCAGPISPRYLLIEISWMLLGGGIGYLLGPLLTFAVALAVIALATLASLITRGGKL